MSEATPARMDASGEAPSTRSPLLSTPLYAFDLPQALTYGARLQGADAVDEEAPMGARGAGAAPAADAGDGAAPPGAARATPASALPACSLCPPPMLFATTAEQRAHYRSTWHRYNLALRQRGRPPVSSDELDELCAAVEEQSDREGDAAAEQSDSERDAAVDPLSALLAQMDVGARAADDSDAHGGDARATLESVRSPLVWFECRTDAAVQLQQTQLGLYRDVLFANAHTPEDPRAAEAALADLHTPPLTCAPRRDGWPAKRLQGTQHVGRAMQLNVLDGAGLVPWLSYADLHGDSGHADTDSDTYDSDTSGDSACAASSLPRPVDALPPLRLWTVILFGGGHFAVATIVLNLHCVPLSERARARGSRPARGIVVLAHKTFHRYTTRRKQGGAQSAQDASGRHAKSAGASLRRAGEAALREEIHTLLGRRGWRELVARSEHVWVRASMRAARGVLWNWGGSTPSPLDAPQRNGTLSHIPLPTQRPTLREVLRVFFELTRVKVAHLSPAELAAQDEAQRAATARALRLDAARRAPAPPPPPRRTPRAKPDAMDEKRRARWERLVAMVRKGKLDTLAHFLARHEDDLLRPDGWLGTPVTGSDADAARARIHAPLPPWWREAEGKSASSAVPADLLQLAAASDQPEILHYLLVERRADPTVTVPALARTDVPLPHRTAYDLCASKASRAVFRRLMAEQPGWYRWDEMGLGGARVPSALTSEMEDAQANKARTRRTALREKARAREATSGAKGGGSEGDGGQGEGGEEGGQKGSRCGDEPHTAHSVSASRTAQRLGGGGVRDADVGLSEDMRMRIERERRARAAEARMGKK
ncbi:hypothetical protein MSPP1_000206 [Malassezia sp. CBS 17886]|nr:hypothetical protein MSPP1_000206 [Malassezia sp. CBS 17886]